MIAAALVLAARGGRAAGQAAGKTVYEGRCAPCHGSNGDGDGPAAAAQNPRPRNFRDEKFWQNRSSEQVRRVVTNGLPGSLMAPFGGVLSKTEIDDVVAYVESFRPSAH